MSRHRKPLALRCAEAVAWPSFTVLLACLGLLAYGVHGRVRAAAAFYLIAWAAFVVVYVRLQERSEAGSA
jgi:hypothetical protein